MTGTVALCANDVAGLEVARYLVANGDRIVRLYLHEGDQARHGPEITAAAGCAEEPWPASALRDPDHVAGLARLAPDWIVTVYWAYLISPAVIGAARRGTVNFHPALLPVNRGWYPHVHSILDGSPTGVTLHAIDATADTGPIWAQREVPLTPYDTASTIYERLRDEIVQLFRDTWPRITAGEIAPIPQDESRAIYHRKREIDDLDHLDLEATARVGDIVNRLRARTFGNRGYAWYTQDGQRVHIAVRLGPSPDLG